jgi:hypothetical protein
MSEIESRITQAIKFSVKSLTDQLLSRKLPEPISIPYYQDSASFQRKRKAKTNNPQSAAIPLVKRETGEDVFENIDQALSFTSLDQASAHFKKI